MNNPNNPNPQQVIDVADGIATKVLNNEYSSHRELSYTIQRALLTARNEPDKLKEFEQWAEGH